MERHEGLRKSERPALVAEAGRGGPSLQENTYHFLLNLSNEAVHGGYPRKVGLLAVLAGRAQPGRRATGHCKAMSESAEGSSYNSAVRRISIQGPAGARSRPSLRCRAVHPFRAPAYAVNFHLICESPLTRQCSWSNLTQPTAAIIINFGFDMTSSNDYFCNVMRDAPDIKPYTFYEFFSGGGMARLGLGRDWQCIFANDSNSRKARIYRSNFHANGELTIGDVANISVSDLPSTASLVWSSFPCQDLSQAGAGRGLYGEESGAFWPFWKLMQGLNRRRRAPRLIVVENVCGTLSSRRGKDFQEIADAFAQLKYQFGAIIIDAKHFVPQSRPRLFFVGLHRDLSIPKRLTRTKPSDQWHPAILRNAHALLAPEIKQKWQWWQLPPAPTHLDRTLSEIIESSPAFAPYDTAADTKKLLALIRLDHRAKLLEAARKNTDIIVPLYRRMRPGKNGQTIQRAEIRTDGIAGCLRTPSGGSSRQTILVREGQQFKSRKITPREAARLMGLPETYELPDDQYEAYHLVADGVAVPVVEFLSKHLLLPLLDHNNHEARISRTAIRNHAAREITRYRT